MWNELLYTTRYLISLIDGVASSYRERLQTFGTTFICKCTLLRMCTFFDILAMYCCCWNITKYSPTFGTYTYYMNRGAQNLGLGTFLCIKIQCFRFIHYLYKIFTFVCSCHLKIDFYQVSKWGSEWLNEGDDFLLRQRHSEAAGLVAVYVAVVLVVVLVAVVVVAGEVEVVSELVIVFEIAVVVEIVAVFEVAAALTPLVDRSQIVAVVDDLLAILSHPKVSLPFFQQCT